MGKQDYHCTPWGMPTYNVFGWQKPCYLLHEGYASSFKELMETTDWESYGTGNTRSAPTAWSIAAMRRRRGRTGVKNPFKDG